MNPIKIKPVLNGYVCEVGCQTVVFIDKKTMLEEIDNYLSFPDKVEEEYMKNSINSKYLKSNPIGACENMPSEAISEVERY